MIGGNPLVQNNADGHDMQISRDVLKLKDMGSGTIKILGLNNNTQLLIGPGEEENTGIKLVERKRMRGGLESYDIMDITGGLGGTPAGNNNETLMEANLSNKDCAAPSITDLATLAKQAS